MELVPNYTNAPTQERVLFGTIFFGRHDVLATRRRSPGLAGRHTADGVLGLRLCVLLSAFFFIGNDESPSASIRRAFSAMLTARRCSNDETCLKQPQRRGPPWRPAQRPAAHIQYQAHVLCARCGPSYAISSGLSSHARLTAVAPPECDVVSSEVLHVAT